MAHGLYHEVNGIAQMQSQLARKVYFDFVVYGGPIVLFILSYILLQNFVSRWSVIIISNNKLDTSWLYGTAIFVEEKMSAHLASQMTSQLYQLLYSPLEP